MYQGYANPPAACSLGVCDALRAARALPLASRAVLSQPHTSIIRARF